MANEKGYKPTLGQFSGIPRDEFLANCAKGGHNSGPTKRRKKLLKDIVTVMLAAEPLETDEVYAELKERGFENSYAAAMMLSALQKACNGDIEASRFIRDTAGQKPTEALAVGINDGLPMKYEDMSDLSDAELMAMIEDLEDDP